MLGLFTTTSKPSIVDVGQIVGGEDAHAAGPHHRARIRARFVGEIGLGGGDACRRWRAPIFTLMYEPGRRTGAFEDILARHHDLHRTPGLACDSSAATGSR